MPDPQNLAIRFELNGQVMQEATTSRMIHNVFEQIAYTSSITTLRPGDVIAAGTPAGVGSARRRCTSRTATALSAATKVSAR